MTDQDDPLARICRPETEQNRQQRVGGVVTAKVEKIEDDGTYRLRFLGMNGQSDDDDSAPARVMAPMAGGKRGVHFFPEPGDEVVVAFQVGDTNQPIILGAVWNRDDEPPSQLSAPARNDVRTIVTRSGHELTFDDTGGAEKVTLKTQGGHTLVLDDAPGAAKVTLASKLGRTLVLDDGPAGGVTLQSGGGQITFSDAGGVMSIQAVTAIDLSAPSISLNGTVVVVGAQVGSSIIDGKPYLLHTHLAPPPAPPAPITGPVTP